MHHQTASTPQNTEPRKVHVRVNENGLRIGESHQKAVLTDFEVERLIADRGPQTAPAMSYSQLAAKYGISKSGVASILKGFRRGQIGLKVKREPAKSRADKLVRFSLSLSAADRARLRRLGGSAWVRAMLSKLYQVER